MLFANIWPQIIALLLYAVTIVRSQDSTGNEYFITPPATGAIHDYSGNPEYQNGSLLQLQWYSDWSSNNLKLFQNDNPLPYVVFSSMGSGTLNYNWTVSFINLNTSLPNIFFFRMNNIDNPDQTFSSHYFNITGDAPPKTTPTPGNNNATSSPTTSTSGNASTTSSASASSGLSSGAKAGIGVGVAVGAVAILALAGAMYWYKKKASRVHHENVLGTNGFPTDAKAAPLGGAGGSPPEYYGGPAEMDNSGAKTEMDDTSVPKIKKNPTHEMPA